jgi:hypothetical protein
MTDKYGNPFPKYRLYPPKVLSPLKAVRHFCLDCCCESAKEVELCPANTCPMWPFRFGRYPTEHVGPKSVLRPIKEKCRDCMPQSISAPKKCEKKCCPVWPYRMGTNPKLKGRGGVPPKAFYYGARKPENDQQSTTNGKTRG